MIRISVLRGLLRDPAGTSVVELGFIAPFFALLTLGTVDASRAVMEKLRLQQVASRTMEMASAGGVDSQAFQTMQAEAAAAANVSTSNVAVDTWLECDRVRQADFNGTCLDTQEVGRYASVRITNGYSPWFASSLAGMGWDVSRAINVEGKASVRVQ